MEWHEAYDVKQDIEHILQVLNLTYIDPSRIFCYRTHGSSARAYARTWAFPKIFQKALNVRPAYVIEVLATHYDKQSDNKKTEILIHELLHIPKNFSGVLLPHHTRSRNLHAVANKLFKEYLKATKR